MSGDTKIKTETIKRKKQYKKQMKTANVFNMNKCYLKKTELV